jgi:hypothetical protein
MPAYRAGDVGVSWVLSVLRNPHDPPGSNSPGGTKIPALEAADAGLGVDRLGFMVHNPEHSHRTEIDTDTAAVTKDPVDIHFHQD